MNAVDVAEHNLAKASKACNDFIKMSDKSFWQTFQQDMPNGMSAIQGAIKFLTDLKTVTKKQITELEVGLNEGTLGVLDVSLTTTLLKLEQTLAEVDHKLFLAYSIKHELEEKFFKSMHSPCNARKLQENIQQAMHDHTSLSQKIEETLMSFALEEDGCNAVKTTMPLLARLFAEMTSADTKLRRLTEIRTDFQPENDD